VETIEGMDEWRETYQRWQRIHEVRDDDVGEHYPWVVNKRAPFQPLRRALPMLNLGLITSTGAYIDGTEPFDVTLADGDTSFREIPIQIEAADLRWAGRGYDPTAVMQDMNAQIPLARLFEFEGNGIIGQLNPVFWSFNGFIPHAARFVRKAVPELIERVKRYEVQAVLLIPASRLCHQTMSLAARALEAAGVPTLTLLVEREVAERVRPPRGGYYKGKFGSVAGEPLWPEHQRRVLDEALRWLEPMDQPVIRKLVVELESSVEQGRGEK
jgi:D-proline reductase (dithiol) PrdB